MKGYYCKLFSLFLGIKIVNFILLCRRGVGVKMQPRYGLAANSPLNSYLARQFVGVLFNKRPKLLCCDFGRNNVKSLSEFVG